MLFHISLVFQRDLEDKCKHSMKKGPADINIEGSYAAPMAAKIVSSVELESKLLSTEIFSNQT